MIAIEQAANEIQNIGIIIDNAKSIRDDAMRKLDAERLYIAEVKAENEEKQKIKTIYELLQSLDFSKIQRHLPTSERVPEVLSIMKNLNEEAFASNRFEFNHIDKISKYEQMRDDANYVIAHNKEILQSAYGVLRYQMDIVQRKLNGFLEDSNIVMERHNTNSSQQPESQIPQESAFQPVDEISTDNA